MNAKPTRPDKGSPVSKKPAARLEQLKKNRDEIVRALMTARQQVAQFEQMLHEHNGAITLLEDMLKPDSAPEPAPPETAAS